MVEENSPDGSPPPALQLSPGTEIGQYTIVEKIGEGGMGEVYLADDSRLRRQVAIKFLPGAMAADEEFKIRFAREARSAASLNHPAIITIHEFDTYQDVPFIVMEYVKGKTLKELAAGDELTTDRIVNIAIQIAEGLDTAHRAGIVHRDLKSENVLIDESGRARILDFGLARVEKEAGITQEGAALGTIAYMSPEQAMGKTVDQRSDLFSLGVILYELVARRLPFFGEYLAAIVNAIMYDEPEPLAESNDETETGVYAIIHKLLTKEVDDRYQSAGELLTDLRPFVASGTTVVIKRTGRKTWPFFVAPAVMVLVLAMAWWLDLLGPGAGSSDGERKKMVAVLPFENRGAPTDDFFANGVSEEIATHLARLRGLNVIARSSSSEYANTEKSYQQIAEELGADFILEGTVQWDRSDTAARVRINAKLLGALDAVHVWAESYDRWLHDIFAVQTDIAQQVTTALNVRLLQSEQERLKQQPTDNMEAYTFYLQGRDYFEAGKWETAQQMFELAIDRDSAFALALANLGRTHLQMYWWYVDRTDLRLRLAREAAETALRLEPDLAEAHLALGRYYYRGFLDYERALQQYELALAQQPNNADLIFAIAAAKRRQGKWDEALKWFNNAANLDPRSRSKLLNLSQTLYGMRQFDSALVVSEKVLQLNPDDEEARALKATQLIYGFQDFNAARDVASAGGNEPNSIELVDVVNLLHTLEGEPQKAVERLLSLRESDYYDTDNGWYYLQLGEAYHWAGKKDLSFVHYDSARQVFEQDVGRRPSEAYYRSVLGVAHAGMGNKEAAIREGLKATELVPVTSDALSGCSWRVNLATIYLMVGEHEEAITEIEYLLSTPSDICASQIRIHPIFESIREDHRLTSMMAEPAA